MPPQALSEEELQLRKRARRRLIGASTLILLIVVFLPMLLDSKPQPLSRDVEIRIPEKNGDGFSSSVVPIDGVASSAAIAAGTSSKTGSPVQVTETVIEPPQAQPKPVAQAVKSEPVKPVEKKTVEAKATESKVAEKPAEKKVTAEKPPKTAEKTHEPAPEHTASSGSGKYVVQLGVFSSMENAKQLQGKLSTLGFKAYTQQVKTAAGEQVRVRMGPYASRSEAEQARDKLKAKQLNAFVIPL